MLFYVAEKQGNQYNTKRQLHQPSAVAGYIAKEADTQANAAIELMSITFLNSQNNPSKPIVFATGNVNSAMVDPKVIIRLIGDYLPVGAVIAHNHPSGNLDPSPEDDAMTCIIASLCNLCGVKLLDHIILSSDSFYSYHEHGKSELQAKAVLAKSARQ